MKQKSKTYSSTKRIIWSIVGIIIIFAIIIVISIFMKSNEDSEFGPNLFMGLACALVSAYLTIRLLNDQTKSEQATNTNVEIYKKRLEIYSDFSEKLINYDSLENNTRQYFKDIRHAVLEKLVFISKPSTLKKLEAVLADIKNIFTLEDNGLEEKIGSFVTKVLALLNEDVISTYDRKNAESVDVEITINKIRQHLDAIVSACPERKNTLPPIDINNYTTNETTKQKADNNGQVVKEPDSDASLSKVENDKSTHDTKANNQDEATEKAENGATESEWNNNILNIHYNELKSNNITCWHFIAWESDVQENALKENNNVLVLVEWGEEWRSDRLQEVRPGDIIFLFNRGGAGYIGMYQVTDKGWQTLYCKGKDKNGNIIVDVANYGEGVKKGELYDEKYKKNDIYDYIDGDEEEITSCIFVEKITDRRGNSYNPISTYRSTISRINRDYSEELLRYFDGQD